MIDQFIKINKETGDIEIQRDIIATYEVFNNLLRRDRGSDGDAQGRRKKRFLQELGYVYCCGDSRSYPKKNGFNEDETDAYAREVTGLPDRWYPDELVNEAIEICKRETTSKRKRIAVSIASVLHKWEKIVNVCDKKIDVFLENEDKLEVGQIEDLVKLLDKVMSIAKTAPDKFKEMEDIIKGIEEEESHEGERIGRGGQIVEDSMDPEKSIG